MGFPLGCWRGGRSKRSMRIVSVSLMTDRPKARRCRRAQLTLVPTMPASVIAERVGWTRGMTVFNERVRELRPVYLPPDPAGRTSYDAGDVAQCDLWFPPTEVPVGYGQTRSPMQLPVLTMVLGYSRWLSAILLPSRRAEDLFA